MLTTVPSINAMLEARIAAARIHGAAAGAQGEAHGAAAMTPASDGAENPVITVQRRAKLMVGARTTRAPAGRSNRLESRTESGIRASGPDRRTSVTRMFVAVSMPSKGSTVNDHR